MNTDISLAAKAVRLSQATEEAAICLRHSVRLKVSWNMAPAFDGLFYRPKGQGCSVLVAMGM